MKHDFPGSRAPINGTLFHMAETFSVGIFERIPKSSGKGTKKTAVKVRVSGPMSNPELVYSKAREICALLDDGKYVGPKNVRVKGGE